MDDEDELAEELANESEEEPANELENLQEAEEPNDANLSETTGVANIDLAKIAGVPTLEMVTEEDSDDEEDVVAEMDHRYGPWSHDHDL